MVNNGKGKEENEEKWKRMIKERRKMINIRGIRTDKS